MSVKGYLSSSDRAVGMSDKKGEELLVYVVSSIMNINSVILCPVCLTVHTTESVMVMAAVHVISVD